MKPNIFDLLNLFLGLTLLIQLYQEYSSPPLLQLLEKTALPRSLHGPSAVDNQIAKQAKAVGTIVNVEDIIRELHNQPQLFVSNPSLKEKIGLMFETSQQLLKTEEEIIALEMELNQIALEMVKRLSPTQRKQLIQERNIASVQKIEANYWQELLQE